MPNVEVEISARESASSMNLADAPLVCSKSPIYGGPGPHLGLSQAARANGNFDHLNGYLSEASSSSSPSSSYRSDSLMAENRYPLKTVSGRGRSESQVGVWIPNGRPVKIAINSQLIGEEDYSDLESETSTLSSSPTSLLLEEKLKFDEALLQEKFEKLGLGKYLKDCPLDESNLVRKEERFSPDDQDQDEEDEEEENNQKGPLIRSTSLKTGKTPPNTPAQKKFVRFADSLGLELALVRNIFQDDLPIVPKSAYTDLKWMTTTTTTTEKPDLRDLKYTPPRSFAWVNQSSNVSILIPEFVQPCVLSNFLTRVRQQKVCLENCMLSSGTESLNVTCVIRVLNVSFEKHVMVRYTLTEWQTWIDRVATYIPSSSDGWSDKFTVSFSVASSSAGGTMVPGQRILFAIRYMANNEEVWDNNMGLNYSLIYRV